jgi:hypothetical protein
VHLIFVRPRVLARAGHIFGYFRSQRSCRVPLLAWCSPPPSGPVAFERISRSTRNCRTSCVASAPARRARRWPGPEALPSGVPPACRRVATHAQIDWAVGSNWRASSSGDRPVRTRSIIRRQNSGVHWGMRLGHRKHPRRKLQRVHESGVNPRMTPHPRSTQRRTYPSRLVTL